MHLSICISKYTHMPYKLHIMYCCVYNCTIQIHTYTFHIYISVKICVFLSIKVKSQTNHNISIFNWRS